MLIIENPHFKLSLPSGWSEDGSLPDSDALHFQCPPRAQKIVVHGFGLLPCETEKVTRSELEQAARREQVRLMRDFRATSDPLKTTCKDGQVHVTFVAEARAQVFYHQLRTSSRPVEGSHTVLSFSMIDGSEACSKNLLLKDAEAVLDLLHFPLH